MNRKREVIKVKDLEGVEREYTISRLPAMVGREIIAKYPTSNIPKIGDYNVSKEAMLLMFKYVYININGQELALSTQDLIDNHVPDGETLIRLELEMLRFNTSFFGLAKNSDFLTSIVKKYVPLIIETLTSSLQSSSPKDSQR